MNARDDGFALYLQTLSESDLRETARDYLWLAEFGPQPGRKSFCGRCAAVITECDRRDLSKIIEELRNELARSQRN